MMKTIFYWCLLILIGVSEPLYSQSEISWMLRFTNSNSKSADNRCFDIQIKGKDKTMVSLGTQSYRFYYDASNLRFLRQSAANLLSSSSYDELKILQVMHNTNASGFGNLDFSETMGFVNMVINDFGDDGDLSSIGEGQWISTVNLCFEIKDPSGPINIVWAREGLTDGYATAFSTFLFYLDGTAIVAKNIDFQDLQANLDQAVDIMVNTNLRN